MKPLKTPLGNDDHETFCHEYIVDFKRQGAYIRTYGNRYSEKTNICALARQVMCRPEVKARIAYLKKQKFKKIKLNREYVIENWITLIEDESTSRSVRLKTINSIAEYLEMLKQKVDVDLSKINDVNVTIEWKRGNKKKEGEQCQD